MPYDAEKLRRIVEKDGRPAYKIAGKIGYPQSLISRLMRVGLKQDPQVGTLEKVAGELGVTVLDFLSPEVEYTDVRAEARQPAQKKKSGRRYATKAR